MVPWKLLTGIQRLRAPAVCLLTALGCIAVHEAGHALASYANGGRVREFVLFSLEPHVTVTGQFTAAQSAFKAAAGSGLLILSWFTVLLAAGRRRCLAVDVFSFFAGIEILAWTISCLLYPAGPRTYDAWTFLKFSGARPGAVILLCALVAGVGVLAYARMGQGRVKPRAKAAAAANSG